MAGVRRWFRRVDRGVLWLIPPVLLYVVVWSYLTLAKYYALNATVWDLGAGLQDMWVYTQVQTFTPWGYVEAVLASPVHFLLMPFGYAESYPAILVFQTVALALGAFPLYLIGREVLGFPPAAYVMSLAYLLYFPIAGVNWYDFHFEALFIPLFLFGYLAYLKKWTKTALVLFVLGGSTTYPYLSLVALFAFVILLEALLYRWVRKVPWNPWTVRFGILLLMISTIYLAYQYWYFSLAFGSSYLTLGINTGAGIGFHPAVVVSGLIALALILAPLAFLTCLAPKWLVMIGPIAFLMLASSYFGYHYPALFQDQYLAAAVPFVLIGAIYGLKRLGPFQSRADPVHRSMTKHHPVLTWWRTSPRSRTCTLGALLACAILTALVFQPYGPLNGEVDSSFGVRGATSINWTAYDQLTNLASLVPRNDPSVLIQNNMPELLPRLSPFYNTPLTSSLLGWENVTPAEVISNQYAVRLIEGNVVTTPLSYAVADPWSVWFQASGPTDNFSMYSVSRLMYGMGYYGLVGEAGGMMVLERGYTGDLRYYVPYSVTYPATELYSAATQSLSRSTVISGTNLSDGDLWYGPYASIAPGLYRVSLSLSASEILPSSHFTVSVEEEHGMTNFTSVEFTGRNFSAANSWQTVSFLVGIPTITNSLEITGTSVSWTGTLSIRSITLNQVGPPTSA